VELSCERLAEWIAPELSELEQPAQGERLKLAQGIMTALEIATRRCCRNKRLPCDAFGDGGIDAIDLDGTKPGRLVRHVGGGRFDDLEVIFLVSHDDRQEPPGLACTAVEQDR
jgi:hypothetical protein